MESSLLYVEMMAVIYESDPLIVAKEYLEKNPSASTNLDSISNGWDPLAKALSSVEMMEAFSKLNQQGKDVSIYGFNFDEWKENVHDVCNAQVDKDLNVLFLFELERRLSDKCVILSQSHSTSSKTAHDHIKFKGLTHVWTKEMQRNRELKKGLLEAELAVCFELHAYLQESVDMLVELFAGMSEYQLVQASSKQSAFTAYFSNILSSLRRKTELLLQQLRYDVYSGPAGQGLELLSQSMAEKHESLRMEISRQQDFVAQYELAGPEFFALMEQYSSVMQQLAMVTTDIERMR
ncbi:hypothetical protein BC829DRAFT_393693 [Chytridium lagenaria]|nr:hypothetical protein BC829DRAFT_393693 [Chytridium lagenaria]